MKNIILASLLIVALMAWPGFAAEPKIIIRQEVPPQAMPQDHATTADVGKDNRLSSKRIKDKTEAPKARIRNATGHSMIRYKTFKDGDGAAKTR